MKTIPHRSTVPLIYHAKRKLQPKKNKIIKNLQIANQPMLKSTMSDNRILQPSAITIVPSVADIFLTLPKTSIIAPPSICSLFGRVYAISSCQALGKVKTQKNPAIKDWKLENKKNGRGNWIRTSDLLVPNQAL